MKKVLFKNVFILVILTVALSAVSVSATTKAQKNKKAHRLYEKRVQTISGYETTKYADLTGDKIDEAIVSTYSGAGSGHGLLIFSLKKGKVKLVLDTDYYGLDKIISYKKSKALIICCSGHGGEHIEYYKMKNDKYKYIAQKGRQNDIEIGPWVYWKGSQELTKRQFNKKIKGLLKGKKSTVKLDW